MVVPVVLVLTHFYMYQILHKGWTGKRFLSVFIQVQ